MLGGAALQPVYAERRQFGRRPCRIPAVIRYRRNSFDCIVLDQSQCGAFLSVADAEILPQRFTLVLPEQGIELLVEVRHRAKNGVGVQFLRGDIASFRDTSCLAPEPDSAASATSRVATPVALAPRQPTAAARVQSPAELRRALFSVVGGTLPEASKRMVAAMPLALRREARAAVVIGATILLSTRIARSDARAATLRPVPFAEIET